MADIWLIKIPNELWIEIFSFICCSLRGGLHISRQYIQVGPHRLAHVCETWREIVLATPQLWSSIYIEPYGTHTKHLYPLVESYLNLSKGVSLQVSLLEKSNGTQPEALVSLIMQHLPRFRVFRLVDSRLGGLPAVGLSTNRFRDLVTLEISALYCWEDVAIARAIAEALRHATALKSVRCCATSFCRYRLFSHRTIQTLIISCIASVSGVQDLFEEIGKMRALRSLCLAMLTSDRSSGQTTIPDLVSFTLKTLCIKVYGYTPHYLQLRLTLPSLRTLDLIARDGTPLPMFASLPQLQSLRNLSLSAGNLRPSYIIFLLHSLPHLKAFKVVETSTSHSIVQPETCIQAFLSAIASTSTATGGGAFLPNLKSLYIEEITPPLSHYHMGAMELLLSTLEADSTRTLAEVRLVFDESLAMVDRAIPLRSSRSSTLTLPKNLENRLDALEESGIKCGVFRFDENRKWRVFGSLEWEEARWRFEEFEEYEV